MSGHDLPTLNTNTNTNTDRFTDPEVQAIAQGMFNRIMAHLLRQGEPAINGAACAYRGVSPTTGKTTMCAVGCLITDEVYATYHHDGCDALEGHSPHDNAVWSALLQSSPTLQALHERAQDEAAKLGATYEWAALARHPRCFNLQNLRELMVAMQGVHDNAESYFDTKGFSWEAAITSRAADVAKRYGLQMPEVSQLMDDVPA